MEKIYKYSCETCVYKTASASNYKIHMKSKKHNSFSNANTLVFECEICKKKMVSRGGLWYHKKKCSLESRPIITTRGELRCELSSVLTEFKADITPTISNTTMNTMNTMNTQNNITMYLNDKCKNAINFMDLMKSIEIGRNYRENVLEKGFVMAICDMIKESFDQMPLIQRPIHYIENEDMHQQIIHIRDNNEWKKETELEWTSQIHNYYSGELSDDTPDPDKKKIFFGLKELEDNILKKINEYYSKSIQFKIFERDNTSEMNYVPNKLKIIKYILENIKVDKTELCSIIENTENIQI